MVGCTGTMKASAEGRNVGGDVCVCVCGVAEVQEGMTRIDNFSFAHSG